MANLQPVGYETVQGMLTIQKEWRTIGTITEANELVREFLENWQQNTKIM